MRKKAVEIAKTWNKNLNPGDTIEGVFTKKEIYNGKFGQTEKYIIEIAGGEKRAIFASASLSNQFANIPEGSYIWVTYKGEEPTSNGRPVKVYDVDFDDEYHA